MSPCATRPRRRTRSRPSSCARSGPSPANVSVPSPSEANASARRTTFFRSAKAPAQRKHGGPSGAGVTANCSRSTPLENGAVDLVPARDELARELRDERPEIGSVRAWIHLGDEEDPHGRSVCSHLVAGVVLARKWREVRAAHALTHRLHCTTAVVA